MKSVRGKPVEMKPVITNKSNLIVEMAEDLIPVRAEVERWAQYLIDLADEVQALRKSAAQTAVLQCVEALGKDLTPLLKALEALEKRMDSEEASGLLVMETEYAPPQEKVYLSQGKGDRR